MIRRRCIEAHRFGLTMGLLTDRVSCIAECDSTYHKTKDDGWPFLSGGMRSLNTYLYPTPPTSLLERFDRLRQMH